MFVAGLLLFVSAPVDAQVHIQAIQEVGASAEARNGDFVRARKAAVATAMKQAVENALVDLMGDQDFQANRRFLGEILGNPARYIRKYRYLQDEDDLAGNVSRVRLEVTLFADAIMKALGGLGVIAGPVGQKSALILITETSLTSTGGTSFWETVPISETALSQEFAGAGIHLVGRDPVRNVISEDTVLKAVKGDISAAVDMGLKAGADIVIVGNAVSALVGKDLNEADNTIQVTLSVKVVSAFKSVLVAAKSEFAVAKNKEPLLAELAAFEAASKKLSAFLVPSIKSHWEGGQRTNQTEPMKERPPMPNNDL